MGENETGQISEDAARIYEAVYLPALFNEWCPLLVEAANIQTGHRVIDVACGTGALAIAASERSGSKGTIIGIDINEGMLNIARSKSSSIEWLKSPAELLPFEDNSFNCVVSQFGLMYFENQENSIREMMRVLQPGGSLAIAVWDKLEQNPGSVAENCVWRQVFGEDWIDESPHKFGDKNVIQNLFSNSGVANIQITTHNRTACFESIESWIHTGAKGWTADDTIDEEKMERLLSTAEKELTHFRTPQGSVAFPTSAHIVTAKK